MASHFHTHYREALKKFEYTTEKKRRNFSANYNVVTMEVFGCRRRLRDVCGEAQRGEQHRIRPQWERCFFFRLIIMNKSENIERRRGEEEGEAEGKIQFMVIRLGFEPEYMNACDSRSRKGTERRWRE